MGTRATLRFIDDRLYSLRLDEPPPTLKKELAGRGPAFSMGRVGLRLFRSSATSTFPASVLTRGSTRVIWVDAKTTRWMLLIAADGPSGKRAREITGAGP